VNLEKESGYEKVTVSASYFDPKINKFRAKRFYIGTLNTWRERYPAKLQEAITHREESLKLYTALTQVTK
jgi:predicted nuclease of restriction endonuclease-like RecB superfamily